MAQDDPEIIEPAASAKRDFPCRACGAELAFVPGTKAIACAFCGEENPIPGADEEFAILEHGYEEWRRRLEELEKSRPHETAESVECDSCKALIDNPREIASFLCPYCNAPMVLEERREDRVRPESLLPFRITHDQAVRAFRTWLGNLWFAPGKLARYARSDGALEGLYLPYWTYDSNTVSHYTGQRGDHYYTTSTSRVNGRTVTTRQRHTRWTSASGTVHVAFDDVLVPASRTLPRKDLDALAPWDLGNLVPYASEYLAGFRAERYQVDLVPGFDDARGIMDVGIRSAVRRDIGGDEQRISTLDTTHRDVKFKHLLLPLWVSAYRYRDKVYRFLVNARTGEVRGERPWSAWKIFFFVTTILLILAALFFVFAG
ncbi:MAG: hypothetical protein R3F20_12130 [Planctomycetota bacterium]